MKKKVFCVMALCIGLFSSCDKDNIGFEEPIVPPIEKPEKPSVIPSINDLIRVKIDNDIMAIVGSNSWYSITYGNGKYVAVGHNSYYDPGFVTTSTDGENWSTPKQIDKTIECVTFGNGKFIILTYADRMLLESTDGENWSVSTKVGDILWNGIKFVNDKFFLLGHNGYISYSTDGVNWSNPKQVGANEGALWNDIAYGAGRYVVVGYGVNNKRNIATSSTDGGDNWSGIIDMHNGFNYGLMSIAYGNDRFIIVDSEGYTFTSTDGGVTWMYNRAELYGGGFTNLVFTNGYFVGIGYKGVFYVSQIGGGYKNWERRSGQYSRDTLWGLCAVE